MHFPPWSRLVLVIFGLLGGLAGPAWAQPGPAYAWARSAGDSDDDRGLQTALDAAGNVYVAGFFRHSTAFGVIRLSSAGDYDVFLAKYTPQGNLLWVRQFGGPGYEFVYDLKVDNSGAAYVTGFFAPSFASGLAPSLTVGSIQLTGGPAGEMFLVKYDAAGNVRWARGTAGSNSASAGLNIALAPNGGVYLTGYHGSQARFDGVASGLATTANIYLARYSDQGVIQWVKTGLGSHYFQVPGGLVVNTAGELYLVGYYRSGFTLGPAVLPAPALNDADMFLCKLDAQGNVLWVRPFIGDGDEHSYGLTLDPCQNVLLAMAFHKTIRQGAATFTVQGPATTSNSDALLLKYSPDGSPQWSRQLGGPATFGPGSWSTTDLINTLGTDARGNVYVHASLHGMFTLDTYSGTNDIVSHLACYSPTGALRWARLAGLYVQDLAVTPQGEVVTTGHLEYTRYFDQQALTSRGNLDVYVAKLAASPLASGPLACVPPPPDEPAEPEDPTEPGEPAGPLFIPNIISPDGDGRNDTFRPRGLAPGPWQLRVYSRWGQQVYHTDNYRQDWDAPGLPAGTYYYHLQHATLPAVKGWLEVAR